MCGIIGGNGFKDLSKVKQGLQTMMHRGTDGNTIFTFDNQMCISHNRLSIQDLSEMANQPMISDDSRFYLAFNGELWKPSFEKFDKKLRKLYNFKTEKSDSELLLYYLIHYLDVLPSALRELEGMFCFALYDSETDTTYLGRDFIGRLPLYYIHENGKFGFSSEAKGLVVGMDEPFYKIDVKSKRYKLSEYKDKEKIKSVPPGTLIKFSPHPFVNEEYEMEEHLWFDWKPPYDKEEKTYYPRDDKEFQDYDTQNGNKGLKYYTQGFRERLIKAVDDETISDVPICTILSGGIDSTIITYILTKELGLNVEAFVVNVNRLRNTKVKDDLYYARMAAKEFGIKLHEVNVDRVDIERALEESIWASETHKWTQISPAVAQLFLSWEIRDKGYKVVFGGEGADEIFASYGDVKRFCWPNPIWYHQKRVNLLKGLHKSNLIRTNKSMMYGGKVELRTPFLNKEVIDFGLRIPTKYRDENNGKGNHMKYILREAFKNDISEELLWRPKKTFQVGCHTDYLKNEQDKIDDMFENIFIEGNYEKYINRFFGHTEARIKIEPQ